ncbi:ClpXP protease specificity-enhancing factor [Hydrogenophaga sp. 5NK40-0174]
MAVCVDESVQVPAEYVNNGEIVLNVSYDATSGLQLGNDYIHFKARFGGIPRDVMIPVSHVLAIYAKENGQGMGFPPPEQPAQALAPVEGGASEEEPNSNVTPLRAVPSGPAIVDSEDHQPDPPNPPPTGGRPTLKRVK